MNVENKGRIFAIIKNINDKNTNSLISIDSKENDKTFKELILDEKFHFQQIPDFNKERDVLYVCGQSGSGKTYYSKNFAIEYKTFYPKNQVYYFSSNKDDDISLKDIKNLKRIVLDDDFLSYEFDINDFKNSLVIFDDIDCMSEIGKKNKFLKELVFTILNSILETGRHHKTSIIYITHVACNGRYTTKILNESHSITIFPKSFAPNKMKYLFEQYIGLSKEDIQKIRKIDSRFVTLIKSFPNIILSEHEAYILDYK